MTALKAGDADGLAREYAPDGVAMDPNMPAAVGEAAIAEAAKASFAAMKMTDAVIKTTDVVVAGSDSHEHLDCISQAAEAAAVLSAFPQRARRRFRTLA